MPPLANPALSETTGQYSPWLLVLGDAVDRGNGGCLVINRVLHHHPSEPTKVDLATSERWPRPVSIETEHKMAATKLFVPARQARLLCHFWDYGL
jgi:hypothetical protein